MRFHKHRFNLPMGFTLLEIVVAVVIIGFLMAMVASRMGSIGTDAAETINKTNIKSMRRCVKTFQKQHQRLPDKLTTVVDRTDEKKEEMNYLCQEFKDCNQPVVYTLNDEEALELRNMGITELYYYLDNTASPEAIEGIQALMIGSSIEPEKKYCNPEWIYRIAFGIGPKCEMVEKGLIEAAPVSPEMEQDPEDDTYNYYNYYLLILPRLKATVDRLEAEGKIPPEKSITVKDASGGEKTKTISLEAQKTWEIDVCSPEGKRWSTGEVDMWEIVE